MNTLLVVNIIALWVLVIALLIAVGALYHHFGQMYVTSREGRANSGPVVGSLARDAELIDLYGRTIVLPSDRPTVLIFVSTQCNICKRVREGLGDLATNFPAVDIVIMCEGKRDAVAAWIDDKNDLATVVADPHGRVRDKYDVDVIPFCVAIGADGLVRSRGIVNGYDGLSAAAEDAQMPFAAEGDSKSGSIEAIGIRGSSE